MPGSLATLHSGRVKCPACARKGVGFAGHPHAFGYKDYSKATCRYCRKTFKIQERTQVSNAAPSSKTPPGNGCGQRTP